MAGAWEVHGQNGSPYTRKVLSFLRFRREAIQYAKLGQQMWADARFEKLRPRVIPVVVAPGGEIHHDSTDIIAKVDRLGGPRGSVYPADPAMRVVALLLEDYFDEWATKAMFGMRWLWKPDGEFTARQLVLDGVGPNGAPGEAQTERMAKMVAARQVGRCDLVGCKDEVLVRRIFGEVCGTMDRHLRRGTGRGGGMYLLGNRPSVADFALYGQMRVLCVDPTAQRLLRAEYPYFYQWLEHMDDPSGPLPGDGGFAAEPPQVAREYLALCGESYFPFLAANEAALAKGEKRVAVDVYATSPIRHSQPPFKYQGRCLEVLRREAAALPGAAAERLRGLLSPAGCWQLLATRGAKL